MPTYLTRPVFPVAVNWAETPRESFAYDLSDRWIGRSRVADPVQSHTARGFEFSIQLRDEAAIDDYDDWSAALRGRCEGFWIPSPFTSAVITGNLGADAFEIRTQDAERAFGEHPSTHVVFTKSGQSDQYAAVDYVIDQYNGAESIALTSSMSPSIDSTWTVRPLLYVRMADDVEDAEFLADSCQRRRIRVVELPTEYAELETGQRPVWLYRFYLDESTDWHFTSLDAAITSNSQQYDPEPITHRGHQRSMRGDRDSVEIVGWHDTTGPMSLFVPFAAAAPMWVQIYETTYSAPDTTRLVFEGKVLSVHASGRELVAECASALDVLGRRVPAQAIQPRCNWLFASTPCGASLVTFSLAALITRLNGPYIDVDDGNATVNYYEHGWLTTGSGVTKEIRQIVRSSALASGKMTLSLNAPLRWAVVGQSVTITAGCDGTVSACKTKFSNFDNWGGHVVVPENPTLRAIDVPISGGKK